MKYAPLVVLAAATLLGGCSRTAAATGETKPAESAEPAAAPVSVMTDSVDRPWYADGFEKLGFYVFPEPTNLPPFFVQARGGGKAIGPEDMKGKITLLNFWATWCPPCRQEMPSIEALHAKLSGEAFSVVAVSVKEDPKTVESFLSKNRYTYPIYLDPTGEASANFAARGIPTTFVLDKNARAIAAIVGSRSYNEPEIIDLLRELARR